MGLNDGLSVTLLDAEIIREDTIFGCDCCGKQHSRVIRRSEWGNIVITVNGTNQPFIMTGLKDKQFCHELCAVRYVIRQERGNG